jgi:Domain of unknown function (DUF4188)
MFSPGMKELGDFFAGMIDHLEKHPEEYGCKITPFPILDPNSPSSPVLGASTWLSTDRPATNEIATICYFRSVVHLHKFAHSPSHREGWTWWNTNLAKHRHIGIMHELYQVPKSNWENIYINYHPTGLGMSLPSPLEKKMHIPLTILAATTYLAKPTAADEKPKWVSPIVDARKGRLRSSAGRMAKDMGDGNEKYGDDPYA